MTTVALETKAIKLATEMWPRLMNGEILSFGDRGNEYFRLDEDSIDVGTTDLSGREAKVGDVVAYDWNDTCDVRAIASSEIELATILLSEESHNFQYVDSADDLDICVRTV